MYPVRSRIYGSPFKFFDGFSDSDFSKFFGTDVFTSAPAVNISESDAGFKIEVAAPGFNKEDFNLNIEKRTLTIKGEHKSETQEKTEKYTRREFQFGSFERKFTLPENVNQDNIEAKYENGVLTINIAKMEEVKQVKEIPIV